MEPHGRASMIAMRLLLRVVITAVALWLAVTFVDGLGLATGDLHPVVVYLGLAVVFGLVNAVVRPIVKLISLPLYVLTLGLFMLVVNALMLWLTGWISEQTSYGLTVDSFGAAFVGALIVSVVSFVLTLVVPGARKKDD